MQKDLNATLDTQTH